ncbi:MAG TPA: hypothetical protein VFK57_14565 [Vicinamibacterales bacterium]|nr:hypothetical protein [Vicinamibacterales bacterium]
MARRERRQYATDAEPDAQAHNARTTSKRGKGQKPDAPRSTGRSSNRRSTGARKSANRPGPSGTGGKKQTRSSSGARRSGSRSGGGKGRLKKNRT